MRMATRNKQPIKYALLLGEFPIYVLDDNGDKIVSSSDDNGNVFYLETGNNQTVYSAPVEIDVNIAFSGGEVQTVKFGIDSANYDATLVYLRNQFPITETSLVWYESEPTYIGHGVNRIVDPHSADYKVLRVQNSLNYTKVLLGKLVNSPLASV